MYALAKSTEDNSPDSATRDESRIIVGKVEELQKALRQNREALADKIARTLATSLLRVLQTWLPPLLAALPEAAAGSRTELWFLHCLTGDAIPTNEAAAKILWAMRGTPPHPPLATSDNEHRH